MTQCTKCLGEGIIGAGERPELRQGALKTCDACGGKGQIPENTVAQAVTEAPVEAPVEVVPESPKADGVDSGTAPLDAEPSTGQSPDAGQDATPDETAPAETTEPVLG